MTSSNNDNVKQFVTAFCCLDIDEQLAVLALIYTKVSGSVSSEAAARISSAEVKELVNKVEKLSQQEQLDAMRNLLPAEKTDRNEVMLDPNPGKAIVELATGGTSVPTAEYSSMNTESKLAFWYQLGQKLGSTVIAMPGEYNPSSKVKELLESLSSLEVEQQVSFLTQVI